MKGWRIELEDVNVWLGGRKVLDRISTVFQEASVTALMGPSGSGKSTLLRTINRLVELYEGSRVEGRVKLNGFDAKDMPAHRLRRNVGMVFQHPVVFPHLSIYENVAIAARIAQSDGLDIDVDKTVRAALEKAMLWEEVKDRLSDPPTRLSGGQKQRLALARALAQVPRVLLLDEPTANLDPRNTLRIEEAVKRLAEQGLTIVIVTHSPQQALRVSREAMFLYQGRIIERGPTRKLVEEPENPLTREYISL